MTTSTGRSPPVLARVLCPFCGRFWFRYPPSGSTEWIEILCRGVAGNESSHLILFRMVNGAPIVEAAHDRHGNPIQR